MNAWDKERQKNIEKYSFKIQFHNPTWVLKEQGGGFDGHTSIKAIIVKSEPFGVISVTKDKKKQCSLIHVWSDGCCDGENCWLINVPNGLFKQVKE